MSQAFSYTVDSGGIARVTFDVAEDKVNTLSPEILKEFSQLIDSLESKKEIKALVFMSGKKESFIAGADLKYFDQIFKEPKLGESFIVDGHVAFDRLSKLPFPTIAVIHGVCLGGGLELALACDYRITTDDPKTRFGLPEVILGIIPGWGGTQRLPRLVGLQHGLKMILSGKPVDGKKAWKIHLVDALIPHAFLEGKTDEFVQKILTRSGRRKVKSRREKKHFLEWILENNFLGRSIVYAKARKTVIEKTKGHYPAPLIALDVIKKTYWRSLKKGLCREKEIFIENLYTDFDQAKYFVWLYFQRERLLKQALEGTPKKIEETAVIGAGAMGSGIAWCISYINLPVRMKDISWNAVGQGYGSIKKIYDKLEKIRKIKPQVANLMMHLVSGTTDYKGFSQMDIVIEAAVEKLEAKQQIFQELERAVHQDCIIGTNTSSLSVTEIAASMKHPERALAMHFFNPANRMPLVEVVAGEKTSPDVMASAVEFCKTIGKVPIVVKECHGFLVNRIFAPGFMELLRLLEEGVPMASIEKAVLQFGWPMEPLVLADQIGNDVSAHAFGEFEKAYGDRMQVPKILKHLVENKWYGVKTKKGFYLYSNGNKEENPALGITQDQKLSSQEILWRMMNPMVNEAAYCLEEGIVNDPADIDMAMIMGVGFPPFRGGLLHYADERGIPEIIDHLENRFPVSELLRNTINFYSK